MAGPGFKRRIDVMVSSTFQDLREYRDAVIRAIHALDLNDRCMEGNPAPDADTIDASLRLVEGADIYVGLLGMRYGAGPVDSVRNPNGLSLTELEFNRAIGRGIPCLMFEVGDDFSMPAKIVQLAMAEGDDGRMKREAFRRRVMEYRVLQPFDRVHDLEIMARQALGKVREELEQEEGEGTPERPGEDDPARRAKALVPLNGIYPKSPHFVGRVSEISFMDQWARGSAGGALVFIGDGGAGKSELTWHWARNRAGQVRSDWAGRLWYSFYSHGASLRDFLARSLGHIRKRPPEYFQGASVYDLGEVLRNEFDSKPWLVVLDGLERMLVAYNKELLSDEEAELARKGLRLKREAADFVRAEDGDVLSMLAQVDASKLLVSSRVFPNALTDNRNLVLKAVRLDGLSRLEGGDLLLSHGIHARNQESMRTYLDHTFAGHPLSILSVARAMAGLMPNGTQDFDTWVNHPDGGRDPGLRSDTLVDRRLRIQEMARGLIWPVSPGEEARRDALSEARIRKVVGAAPEQQIAPVQFDREDEKLAVLHAPGVPEGQDASVVASARKSLELSGKRLIRELVNTQCDRRIQERVCEFHDEIMKSEDIVFIGMQAEECQRAASAYEEISPMAAELLAAYFRSVMDYVSQFPEWRRFRENVASAEMLKPDLLTGLKSTVNQLRELVKDSPHVTEEVPQRLEWLSGLLEDIADVTQEAVTAVSLSLQNMASAVIKWSADLATKAVAKAQDHLANAAALSFVGGLGVALWPFVPISNILTQQPWLANALEWLKQVLPLLVG